MSQYDIVLFGASSFVGQIICRYLVEAAPKAEISWAIAGRNQQKLEDLRASLGSQAAELPILLADAADQASLTALCQQTRVIMSTVGPYALYGEPLIQACVTTGTDYCDLTGEPQWIINMLARYEEQAKQSGARIVHCCGFDSIPSDLGVYVLQQQAIADTGQPCNEVNMCVTKLRGNASGGTIASMLQLIKEVSKDKALRKQMTNPYALCAQGHPYKARQHVQKAAEYSEPHGLWTAPFVMAAINSRVVHRTNSLLGNQYGEAFLYQESMGTGAGDKGKKRAGRFARGLSAFMLGAAIAPTRWLLERFFLPKPGEGPSLQEQENGCFECVFIGQNAGQGQVKVKVTGDKDPGYGSTAKMISQAAICLAKDLPQDQPGGFWTPASLMAEPLKNRLAAHAGVMIAVVE